MANIYAHGVPETIIENVTLSTHDWGDTSTWENGINDSKFEIKPANGELMVLRECLIKFSSNMKFSADNALCIEVTVMTPDGIVSVPVAIYNGVKDFIKREDRVEVIDLKATEGDITRPVVKIRLFFARQIILWNTPGVDKLGQPKCLSLIARLANNQPFKMANGDEPEIAVCRYFLTRHSEADVE